MTLIILCVNGPLFEDQFGENSLTFSCRNRKVNPDQSQNSKSALFAPSKMWDRYEGSFTSFSSMKAGRRRINLIPCCMFSSSRFNDKY